MLNALSIDVEDYFMVTAFADSVRFEDWGSYETRVERNTSKVLDLLDEHGIKATFFVLGWVAERFPALVADIAGRGHEVASHGYNHRLAYELSPTEFREDARRSKTVLEDLTGKPVLGYRAASYSITKESLWALDILIEEGFLYDSSIFPIHHTVYGHPGFSRFPQVVKKDGLGEILELPPSTIRFLGKNIPIAGGGYLRLFPLSFIERGIRSINRNESQPAIIYFHPWEVDPGQPRLNGRMLSVIRHNINIGKTFHKIKKLLTNFEFGPIKEVYSKELSRIKDGATLEGK